MQLTIDINDVARTMIEDMGICPEDVVYCARTGMGLDGWTDALIDTLENLYELEAMVMGQIIKVGEARWKEENEGGDDIHE